MVIKTFEYTVLKHSLSEFENFEKKEFSIDIAEKALYTIYRAVTTANINHSKFISSTKTKSEVRGGGRKPWKQKGTGNARAGSKRSPLWRGGGVTFGPKPRIVIKKINKKEKQLALRTIFYNKHKQFTVFDKLELDQPKTSEFLNFIDFKKGKEKTLIISSKPNKNLQFSLRNLKNFQYILANQLNVNQLTKANKIILDENSFDIIKETYCNANK